MPSIAGLVASRLTIGGVSTLFPSPYAVDGWLDMLHLRRLDDILTRGAQPAIDLIIELDGMRCFNLGVEGRPVVERGVREDSERGLADALFAFEVLAAGEPVQPLLRRLSEEVAAGQVALAEGVAAVMHGRLTSAGEALMRLSTALLAQDLARAMHVSPTTT